MPSQATYDQRTGAFVIYGEIDDGGTERVLYETKGYAGRGVGKNNPDYEMRRGLGPLPIGRYQVLGPFDHRRFGPICFRLLQISGPTYGRSGFLIHGDSKARPGSASSGCIILSRDAREAVREYDVAYLEVCASLAPKARVLE